MVSGSDTVDQEKDKTAALTRERDRLKELATDLQEQIEKITNEYPYTVRPIIREQTEDHGKAGRTVRTDRTAGSGDRGV